MRLIVDFRNSGGRVFAVATTEYPPVEGENWSRGNDIADGFVDDESAVERIVAGLRDVLSGERG